jgi:hypothetical protein
LSVSAFALLISALSSDEMWALRDIPFEAKRYSSGRNVRLAPQDTVA